MTASGEATGARPRQTANAFGALLSVMQDFGQDRISALIALPGTTVGDISRVQTALADMTRTNLDSGLAALKDLLAAPDLSAALRIQTAYAQDTAASLMAQGETLQKLSLEIAESRRKNIAERLARTFHPKAGNTAEI